VTNRPYVYVGLRTFKFTLGHDYYLSLFSSLDYVKLANDQDASLMIASAIFAGTSLYLQNSMV